MWTLIWRLNLHADIKADLLADLLAEFRVLYMRISRLVCSLNSRLIYTQTLVCSLNSRLIYMQISSLICSLNSSVRRRLICRMSFSSSYRSLSSPRVWARDQISMIYGVAKGSQSPLLGKGNLTSRLICRWISRLVCSFDSRFICMWISRPG